MKIVSPKISSSLLRKFFGLLIFFELFTFGSGQLIKVYHGVTFRIVSFFMMVLIGIFLIPIKRRIDRNVLFFLAYFSLFLAVGVTVGITHTSFDKVFIDIKYFSYFLTILFFYYYIKDLDNIKFMIRILTTSAFIVSIVYLIYLALYTINLYDFESVYKVAVKHEDFRFRGASGALFYKGFIYLPVALVFINVKKGLISLQGLCILLAIYFSETRGLWILAVLAYMFSAVYIINKNKLQISISKSIILLILLSVLIMYIFYHYSGLTGDRAGGDRERIETIKQVIERINPVSLFIGHGFGVGVPIREVHMEMSYLEIFHKLGIFGLLFYILLLVDIFRLFLRKTFSSDLVSCLWFSIVLVYIGSLFNPYLTNSIGMGFIVIAYVSLVRMKQVDNSLTLRQK